MSTTIRRKRGDTFRLRFCREGGIDGVTITAMLRFGTLEIVLQPAVVDAAAGVFDLGFAGSTAAWPTGRGACDIKYVRDGEVLRSDTFFVQILEAMTP